VIALNVLYFLEIIQKLSKVLEIAFFK